jgi:hypothetical protein
MVESRIVCRLNMLSCLMRTELVCMRVVRFVHRGNTLNARWLDFFLFKLQIREGTSKGSN